MTLDVEILLTKATGFMVQFYMLLYVDTCVNELKNRSLFRRLNKMLNIYFTSR